MCRTYDTGEYMTVNAGSVPQPGDLVFADVWIHGTIATGLDPVPTSGTLVRANQARILLCEIVQDFLLQVTSTTVRPTDSDMQE